MFCFDIIMPLESPSTFIFRGMPFSRPYYWYQYRDCFVINLGPIIIL